MSKDCQSCDHCIYIGEGDFICDRCEPVIVMEDFCPNDNYCCCNTGLRDTQKQKNYNKIKGGDSMVNEKETRKYVLKELDRLYASKDVDWFDKFVEFLGTAVCDMGCKEHPNCEKKCKLWKAVSLLKYEPTIENYNSVKAIVGCKIHEILKGG